MEETKNDYITIIKKIFKWVILSIIMYIYSICIQKRESIL